MSGSVGYKVLSAAGLVLAVVMLVLLQQGTTDSTMFVVWGVLAIAGLGLFALGGKLDSDARRRALEAERRSRLGGGAQPGPPRV